MAKMIQDTVVITVAKLLRDDDEQTTTLSAEVMEQLEAILGELIDDSSAMVEIAKVSE